MREKGIVEFIDDAELKRKLSEEQQFLKALGFAPESSDLAVFRIAIGEAYF
jgi:pyridoxamine 5'-phosphate oxidase